MVPITITNTTVTTGTINWGNIDYLKGATSSAVCSHVICPLCPAVHTGATQWELDLHGLHVSEALQSLQERVQLLRDIAQDLRKTAAAAGVAAAPSPAQPPPAAAAPGRRRPHAAPLQGCVRPAGGSTKQAVLTSLLLPDDSVLSWEQQLAAMRQELRVIVGKGLHSSGGEASLPRVVEQWLLRHGYKYIWREGCISVQLRLL